MRLLAFTRQGYEQDALKELIEQSGAKAADEKTAALAIADVSFLDIKAISKLDAADFIFGRELVLAAPLLTNLPEKDRITPIIEALGTFLVEAGFECIYRDIVVTFPDSEKAKPLSKFCGKFAPIFENKLKKMGFKKVFSRADVQSIYVIFLSYEEAYVGFSTPTMQSVWPGGVARLKFPANAPSRSYLKIEEALLLMLDDGERDAVLKPGMSVVDLGAAPGGWTQYFVDREIYVTAIDNADLSSDLSKSDYVVHKRGDAFKWQPKMPVDWLVCDVVENPFRIADLVVEWTQKNLFTYAVINFKLPMMKDRLSTVNECRLRLSKATKASFKRLSIKQLYHDRDEVTVFIERKVK